MLLLEPALPEPMLLGMVTGAQANAPAVGGLEGCTSIGAGANMGALDGQALAAGHRAVMAADPGTMGRAGTRWLAMLRAL